MNGSDTLNILVSSCLLGINSKYSGGTNINDRVMELLKKKGYTLIPVCPEQLGGLATPREPAEIQNGTASDVLKGDAKVANKIDEDVTEQFVKGAIETLRIAKLYNCSAAILKSKSPTCGYGIIYDGSFSGRLIEGNGVTAQLLSDNGIKVMGEDDFKEDEINITCI